MEENLLTNRKLFVRKAKMQSEVSKRLNIPLNNPIKINSVSQRLLTSNKLKNTVQIFLTNNSIEDPNKRGCVTKNRVNTKSDTSLRP